MFGKEVLGNIINDEMSRRIALIDSYDDTIRHFRSSKDFYRLHGTPNPDCKPRFQRY